LVGWIEDGWDGYGVGVGFGSLARAFWDMVFANGSEGGVEETLVVNAAISRGGRETEDKSAIAMNF
jgi:hypothetical protein